MPTRKIIQEFDKEYMNAPSKKKVVIVPHTNKETAISAISHLFVDRA